MNAGIEIWVESKKIENRRKIKEIGVMWNWRKKFIAYSIGKWVNKNIKKVKSKK